MIRLSNAPQSEMTASPNKYPQGKFKDKSCRLCSEVFSPMAPSHHYCSDRCKSYMEINNYYVKVYKVTYADVLTMLEHQNYLCAICKEVGFNMNKHVRSSLNLDHCHATGQVRGLLCHNCNRALGLFKDDVERMKTAIEYLEGATTISKESTLK